MKYPRGAAFDSAVVNLESGQPEFSSQNSNSDSNICEVNLSLLEKLVTLSSNIDSGKVTLLGEGYPICIYFDKSTKLVKIHFNHFSFYFLKQFYVLLG